jgi:quercetin dioxygenase-like cupin family protein
MDGSTTAIREVFACQPEEGEARWWMGSLAIIKATSHHTAGQFALVEVIENEGETPLHVHYREDETFWVLDGRVEFELDGQTIEAGPGTMLFGPRGVPHRYIVRKGPARMLFLFTPGGFEGLLRATSAPAAERRIPYDHEGVPDFEALPALAKQFGCEMLA